MEYYAHTSPFGMENDKKNWQKLNTHLTNVGELTSKFASEFGMENEGKIIGLTHDLGKYSVKFQKRLENPNEITGINHWTPSSIFLYDKLLRRLMLCVEGHHTGIPNFHAIFNKLKAIKNDNSYRIEMMGFDEPIDDIGVKFLSENIINPQSLSEDVWKTTKFKQSLKIRMLFSCLIDADRLDTENHFNKQKSLTRIKNCSLNTERAIEILENYVKKKSDNSPDSLVNSIRRQLLQDCIIKSQYPKGIFNLTGPTGSGKTLASLMFALKHAFKHSLRRLIYVIPYTSIIDQTAKVYSDVFKQMGSDYILEHHSSVANLSNENLKEDRLLGIENWDRPIILTTSVQFFESLFSNYPSTCRKLHNISNSVIVLDEVQNIPVKCVPPILSVLEALVSDFGCTVVMGTATQPAFDICAKKLNNIKWNPTEIVSDTEKMSEQLKRTRFVIENKHYPTWEEIATRIDKENQYLCVVNTKRDASLLYNTLKSKEGKYHLSTGMVSIHRKAIIRLIRNRLKKGLSCRTISTQLIEAGVDVDFPTGDRAIAPLDSIIQTGGRCNREGKMDVGYLNIIFPSDGRFPKGSYQTSLKLTDKLLKDSPDLDFHSPSTYKKYYEVMYERVAKDSNLVMENIEEFAFEKVAENFHVIDSPTVSILVPYNVKAKKLIKQVTDNKKISMDVFRQLQKYTVNIFYTALNKFINEGFVRKINDDYGLYVWDAKYSRETGIVYELDIEDFIL